MHRFLKALGTLDLRALGLLRIGTGLMLLADVWSRIGMAREHYSDEGFLPRTLWEEAIRQPGTWSLHLVSGDASVQVGLLLLTALVGLALVAGIRTRLSTVLAFVLVSSIQARNPDINHGGDAELRLILFWAMFLPWGRRYTLGPQSELTTVSLRSAATVAYSVQIALVYVASAFLKRGPHWREDFTAVYYTLNIAGFARAPAAWIAGSPGVATALTIATLIFEFVGPIVLLLSGAHWRLRMLAALGFVGLHVGFATCMHLSTFPFVCIVSMAAFLPGPFFDRVAPAVEHKLPRVRLFLQRLRDLAAAGPGWLFDVAAPQWADRLRPLLSGVVVTCLVCVLAWNVGGIRKKRVVPLGVIPVARAVGLAQYWGMFVNRNAASTWLVVVGRTATGLERDPLTDRAPRWDMPSDLPSFYGDFRTGRFMATLFYDGKERQRAAYAHFLCREWNGAHPTERFENVQIYWAVQPTPPPRTSRPAPHRRLLADVRCPARL